jgi:hypothetical protein
MGVAHSREVSTFTCITLSPEPVVMRIPKCVEYINEVSVFKSVACDYAARLRAIAKVNTTHFFFLDSDDEYGDMLCPSDSLTIGIEHRTAGGISLPSVSKKYTPELHLAKPQIVHGATCINTEAARKALADMPQSGEYYFQLLFYYTLIQKSGFEYSKRLRYNWNIRDNGFHTKASDAIANTKKYLRDIIGTSVTTGENPC